MGFGLVDDAGFRVWGLGFGLHTERGWVTTLEERQVGVKAYVGGGGGGGRGRGAMTLLLLLLLFRLLCLSLHDACSVACRSLLLLLLAAPLLPAPTPALP